MRYAWFPDTARMAIDDGNGRVRVYDTADHRIGGFSQQQSGGQSLSFTSQHGLVKLSELREVEIDGHTVSQPQPTGKTNAPSLSDVLLKAAAQNLAAETLAPPAETPQFKTELQDAAKKSEAADEADIFAKIERLAALHAKGILTDAEYQTKKAELLARI